jgi:enoyl-CoA hydratase
MNATLHSLGSDGHVLAEIRGSVGVITLNRPQALNSLSLAMIRDITSLLLAWRDDAAVKVVLLRGTEGKSAAFCAGGDIRFFHQAGLAGDPRIEDFFTEEYTLDHMVHRYPKPCIALMDGIVMGGGMGIGQGASLRIVTERSKLAMPETNIGLFPDVGGGCFLSRCPGRVGEFMALTGQVVGAGDAMAWGLADACIASAQLPAVVDALASRPSDDAQTLLSAARQLARAAAAPVLSAHRDRIDRHFAGPDVRAIFDSLAADNSNWATETLAALRKRSPLMMCVALEQIRRARGMSLADDLRMERDMVRHCFALRPGAASETVEGIRALAIDKDHSPRWNPATVEGVTREMVDAFFVSPWTAHAHPLRALD